MKENFNPPSPLKNKHIQTLYASLFRKLPFHNYDRERFELSDGDFIECFWYNKRDESSKRPLVLLFHGLAGSYKSPYIQGTMRALDDAGYDSVAVHFRGCSGIPNRKVTSYHSGKTDDSLEFLNSVFSLYSDRKVFCIGYSLGGNMLLKLLGELSTSSKITASVSVSAPMQLDICGDEMDNAPFNIYRSHLIKRLNKELEQKFIDHDMKQFIKLKQEEVRELKTFREFDSAYTAPIHGFDSAQDYYTKCSSKQFLSSIATPTLIIQALDDPFMTPEILPTKDEMSSSIELEVYKHGGHVGFITGTVFKPEYWLESRVVRYFNTLK